MAERNLGRRARRLAVMLFAAIGLIGTGEVLARAPLTTQLPDAVASGTATRLGALPAGQSLELAISLPLRDEAGLDAFIAQLYDPHSAGFHRYLTPSEFADRFGPSAADYEAVVRFASAHGLTVRGSSRNRLVVNVTGSVSDIERALHVRMNSYQHPTESRSFYAPDREPTLDLAVPVLHISGLDDFVKPSSHLIRGGAQAETSASGTGSGPGGSFYGSDIRAAYYGGTALTGAGQSVGLLELAGYNLADVQHYFLSVRQSLNVPVVGVSVNGASLDCSSGCSDAEQVLDIEETISMAPGLSQVRVYVGSSAISILSQMASDDSCMQLSSSWGWASTPTVLDPIFKEFAAQGQSFVDATGDDGYHLKAGVVWPADDAYVTAIGGTSLVTSGPGGPWASETGWTYSGGGPSPDGIAIPTYQVPFINSSNQGSTTLRNVPDIAGAADNFYSCYDKVCTTGNGGTSYAAPLWAGFIALVNQQATQQGQAVVGFLNPRLYALGASANYASDFHDETSGNNGKYYAVSGFDLVTGFGSPNGQTLIDALIGGR